MGHAGFSRVTGIVLAAAVSLAAAGDRAVYASSPVEPKKDCFAAAGSAAAPLAITLNAKLTGTVMVDGGRSLALFEPSGGIGLMREGEAFADGTLLCEVQADRIVVGRGGIRREIFLGSQGQSTVTASPPSVSLAGPEVAIRTPVFAPENAPPTVTGGERHRAQPAGQAGLLDLRAANFHLMLERRQAQTQ